MLAELSCWLVFSWLPGSMMTRIDCDLPAHARTRQRGLALVGETHHELVHPALIAVAG